LAVAVVVALERKQTTLAMVSLVQQVEQTAVDAAQTTKFLQRIAHRQLMVHPMDIQGLQTPVVVEVVDLHVMHVVI
jgi:hypothetical protein